MSEEEQDPEREPSAWLVWVVPSLGAVVLIGAWVWLRFYVETKAHQDYATVGDALAPIVGLFTAVALGAALRSVALQRHELRLQRRELQLAREEARQSREAQQAMALETEHANILQDQSNQLAALGASIALLNIRFELHRLHGQVGVTVSSAGYEEIKSMMQSYGDALHGVQAAMYLHGVSWEKKQAHVSRTRSSAPKKNATDV